MYILIIRREEVAFWRKHRSQPGNHKEGPWFEAVVGACVDVTPVIPINISEKDVVATIRTTPIWKSPGPNRLHHYWLK